MATCRRSAPPPRSSTSGNSQTPTHVHLRRPWERSARHARIGQGASVGYLSAVVIGVSQALALLAGISREGVAMVGGLFRGLDNENALRFSFLLSNTSDLRCGSTQSPRSPRITGQRYSRSGDSCLTPSNPWSNPARLRCACLRVRPIRSLFWALMPSSKLSFPILAPRAFSMPRPGDSLTAVLPTHGRSGASSRWPPGRRSRGVGAADGSTLLRRDLIDTPMGRQEAEQQPMMKLMLEKTPIERLGQPARSRQSSHSYYLKTHRSFPGSTSWSTEECCRG